MSRRSESREKGEVVGENKAKHGAASTKRCTMGVRQLLLKEVSIDQKK